MKYQQEYRDPKAAMQLVRMIESSITRDWSIMEVCGGQTHAIVRYGIDQLIPDGITLIHGPGCPVCVTPLQYIDKAIEISHHSNVIFCSYGDMLRVPGTDEDLLTAKSTGADIRIVYSPMDAVDIARENPDKKVVFFAVGFETTAPANAMSVYQCHQEGIRNYSMLVSHVLVPPAMEAILSTADSNVQAFLAAGHVCSIMGWEEYLPLSEKYHVPVVVTGFEPLDILEGIYMCLKQLESGVAMVENQYVRAVTREGNRKAQNIMNEVFSISDRHWRGIGEISNSGMSLSRTYEQYDAESHFGHVVAEPDNMGICISGDILRGTHKPDHCPAFGKQCTPEHPLGVTMVSSEGACAAYYRYRNREVA